MIVAAADDNDLFKVAAHNKDDEWHNRQKVNKRTSKLDNMLLESMSIREK